MKASTLQKRFFFALAHELGYDHITVKERAKKKYKLESFRDISSEQINTLIEILHEKTQEKHYGHNQN